MRHRSRYMTVVERAFTRAFTIALNFVRTNTPESCTRLCAVMCCSTGCLVGLAATGFGFAHPGQTGAIVALTGIEAGLIASGCVALLTRSHPTGADAGSEAGDAGGPTP